MPNGTAVGPEEVGCIAKPPAEKCVISLDESKYPPGTKFNVSVYSESEGASSDPESFTVSTSMYILYFKLQL